MIVDVPEDIFDMTRLTREELLRELAIMLLKQGRIGLEAAGCLAGMSKSELLNWMTNHFISTRYNADDVQRKIDLWRAQLW